MNTVIPKISLAGVEKRFTTARGGQHAAISRLDLNIASGEFVCLVGPSGCGKTTLINLMAGFEHPTGGSVHIDGRPVTGPDPDHIMIFQDYGLYPWRTVLGNVLFGLQSRGLTAAEAEESATAALELVGLTAAKDMHPHELSGGMKQRVAIARALAVSPSILFMDEPFAALDTFTRFHLQDELLRIWQEKMPTIVFVTHDLDEAITLGRRIVLLAPNPGRIQRVMDVSLPYPRERTESDFAVFRKELSEEFHLVHRRAQDQAEYEI
ncbi:MAG TPA: ABC transporter ATP-binding protein [Acidobacteriota bacterium]|nr:ABC transporter ATP-binding protein [Acidobacteriota bacterium]